MSKTIIEQIQALDKNSSKYRNFAEKMAKVWLIILELQAEREAESHEDGTEVE